MLSGFAGLLAWSTILGAHVLDLRAQHEAHVAYARQRLADHVNGVGRLLDEYRRGPFPADPALLEIARPCAADREAVGLISRDDTREWLMGSDASSEVMLEVPSPSVHDVVERHGLPSTTVWVEIPPTAAPGPQLALLGLASAVVTALATWRATRG